MKKAPPPGFESLAKKSSGSIEQVSPSRPLQHFSSQKKPHSLVPKKRAPNAARKPAINLAHSNFRFVFSPHSGFSTLSLGDLAALPVQDFWNDLVLVLSCVYDLTCPLCLDDVQLAQALPCGHVFCDVCVHRLLKFAESENPMLYKCCVCQEGHLSLGLLKPCISLRRRNTDQFFALVNPPSSSQCMSHTLKSNPYFKFALATGEFMVEMVTQRREEVKVQRKDLERFRDSDGLAYLSQVDKKLDMTYIEWYRLVGKTCFQDLSPQQLTHVGGSIFYQSEDGALEFLHPLCVQWLELNHCFPPRIQVNSILETNAWDSVMQGKRIHKGIPPWYHAHSGVFVELDLQSVAGKVVADGKLKQILDDRARRRRIQHERRIKGDAQAAKTLDKQMEERIRQREEEERLLLDFFGYDQARKQREEEESRRPKPVVPHSFSSVVSNMGHYPALATPNHPNESLSSSGVVVGGGVWGNNRTSSGGGATTQQGKKKVPLFQNNPSSRRTLS